MRSQAKERGIKSARSAWIKERSRSKFKTRMVGKESLETSRKYKEREKGDRFSRTKKPNCRSS